SMPATAKFLHAVAKLPRGAVVLPGLDTDLDEESWQSIGGTRGADGKFDTPPSSNHPQYAMHALLDRFAIRRGDIEILGTPRRVTAALGRWNLAFDDSGGDALMETPAGIFARLTAEAATRGSEPPTLLALLKHPLLRLGGAHGALKHGIEVLELALLRGTRPQSGSGGLAADFTGFRDELRKLNKGEASSLHRAEPRTRLRHRELDRAEQLISA